MAKRAKKKTAASKRKTGKRSTKRSKKAKKVARPTKFQNFLMREGVAAKKKVPAWRHLT
jgi:hypothetical protein